MSQEDLNDMAAAVAAGVLENADHPSPDELLAYQAGDLDDAAAVRLREHLAWCSECASTVLDLASWPDVELEETESHLVRTEAEEAADWQAIRSKIGAKTAPLSPIQRSRFGLVHALAAALLAAVIGLSFQVARLSPPTLPSPQKNVFLVDLEPVGSAATRDTVNGLEIPQGMEALTVLLLQDRVTTFADYRVELREEGGEVLWGENGLVSLPEGGFTLSLPLASLPSAIVEIHLFGIQDGKEELLSTYRTRIQHD